MRKCKNCVTGLFFACGSDYCFQERQGLVEEATFRAEQRGHTLSEFTKDRAFPVWRARCLHCNREAIYQLDPEPGESDVHGEALITDCPR